MNYQMFDVRTIRDVFGICFAMSAGISLPIGFAIWLFS